MAGWDDTPPGKDKDAQASHFAFNQFSAAFATDAPISASKFGREKRSFDDWSAPPVYALDEHASNKPTLFVGNLSWTITSEALFARLGGIGSVVACEVKRNGKGQSKGFALATFQSEEAAQRAIAEFHGAVLEGRRLEYNVWSLGLVLTGAPCSGCARPTTGRAHCGHPLCVDCRTP